MLALALALKFVGYFFSSTIFVERSTPSFLFMPKTLKSLPNSLILVGMGFVTAALCGLSFAQQANAPQKIWQGFGVNIHFTEPAPGEIELLKASGVDYVRTDFTWELTEKAVGKYDFSTYDKLVGHLKSAHIRPLFVLDYGNKLYDNGAPRSAKAQDAYAHWTEAVITHFRGEEIVWELWNEPNTDHFWRPKADASSYASLALKAAMAMRAADPNCRIIAPGTSRIDDDFLKKVLSKELLGLIDGVSVHPYRAGGPETVMKDIYRVKDIITAKAPAGRESIPVVCSEWGYSTAPSTGVNEDRQAMYLDKLWLLSAAAGSPVTIYYDWKDDGSNGNNIDHRFGIVRQNLKLKPSYDAARLCTKAFKGCTFYKRMVKSDPLDWIIIGVGEGKMVRASWYQKLGGLPKFEAYDMKDRSNRRLYNKLVAEANAAPAKPVDPPKKDPPKIDPPKKDPPLITKNPGALVKTNLTIAYAPPIDSEGWCAVIEKPSSMANTKVEFQYNRKDTGADVSCFTNVKSDRLIEPLANNDSDSVMIAMVGGKPIGNSTIKRVELDPAMWVLKGGAGGETMTKTQMGGSIAYNLSAGILKIGLSPASPVQIPEGAKRFVIWIKPDGSMNNLYARFTDEAGGIFQVNLGVLNGDTDRNGWRAVVIPFVNLPSESGTPTGRLQWDHLFYIEAGDKNNPKSGRIEYGPAAYEY